MNQINESTISFTTTAMPRPEVVAKTYDSFSQKILGLDLEKVPLYINIDPFPGEEKEDLRNEVVDIARQFFGKVVVNMPQASNFAAAVKWCFSRVETPFNFHLEDDWQLLDHIKVSTLSRLFIPEHIQQVALRSRENVRQDFWLCPSIIRGEFCREMAKKMKNSENPEVGIRDIILQEKNYKKSSFIYFPFDYRKLLVRDLGRSWMETTRFKRGGTHFKSWSVGKEKSE